MNLGAIDIAVFIAFVVSVISIGLLKSRKEKTSEDYFLAGRGLTWWLVGFSLIAANISTEQFVGMSGNAYSHHDSKTTQRAYRNAGQRQNGHDHIERPKDFRPGSNSPGSNTLRGILLNYTLKGSKCPRVKW